MHTQCNQCQTIAVLHQYKRFFKQLKIKFNGIHPEKIMGKSTEQGLSIRNMQDILEEYGVYSEAYEVSDIEKLAEQEFPMILMCKNSGMPHYVVLHKTDGETYIVSDPAKPQIEEKREWKSKKILWDMRFALIILST